MGVRANQRRVSPLLVEDDGSRNNRPAECQFGKNLKELGSTWFADLGPPFGVMYCLKCECVPVTKRRRIVARVQCRNIKNECPKAMCDEPIQLPGRCCKVCPGDIYNPDISQDVPSPVTQEEEERNMKHFGALLTGRTSYFLKREEVKSIYSTNNPLNIVATGRFTFHKKNLYYSFYTSEKIMRPRLIQFIDETGHILEEHSLLISQSGPFSVYQNSTGKICGVWRRVPRDYRKLLKDELLNVVLLWGGDFQAELAIAGKISKYPALSTELFSSLLEPAPDTSPEQMSGSGGTAIVSTSSGSTSSIHMTLVVNGLFGHDEIADVPLNIRLESVEKKQVILEDVVKVKKPAHDYNVIEFSSPVSTHDLRLLTRGKLVLTIESRKNPSLKVQGNIVTRVSCELFQTLLAPHNIESKTRSSGLAWLYLNKDGSLVYNIHTDDLNLQENPVITLLDDRVKRKTELEDLTSSLSFDNAIGIIDRLGPRVLEPLYSENLAINVATRTDENLIRGRLIARPVADARDSVEPILLKRLDQNSPAHLIGMAWLAVDNQCSLHYEITLNGFLSHQQKFQLLLEEIPIEAPGAPVSRKILEEFSGHYTEGFLLGMTSYELAKLETSVCYLEVRAQERGEVLLRGKLKATKIPSQCFPVYTDNNVQSVFSPNDHNDNHLPAVDTKCYHSNRFYDEGEQWKSGLEECTMCSCVHGRVKCEPFKCPPINCKADDLRTRTGECCPLCLSSNSISEFTNSSVSRGCRLGDQFHSAGSSWHPYLPPNGYDTCAVCTCDPKTLEINCPRVQCPSLNCSEKVAFRPDKKACCKKCPNVKQSDTDKTPSDMLRDQGSRKGTLKSTEEIIANGGCNVAQTIYENGQEWHPVLPSHGEQKCIKCRCKDTNITCDRKRCTRSICNNRLSGKRRGMTNAQNHEIDECCSNQCRRSRRHQNQKRYHRDNSERQSNPNKS
ncbi:Dorsal-ventral patterning protein Sog [Pseudolycoriella hygida]|uniref:Dorsal-ventral patterning protein Sog n=1 Tax=Pseudolycoriella hygida TaxID=35572 RepID=A0A9Q0RWS1_9DIPT|nr:Dorsal-ventral patterning protein Sog [Pseudolycoriella hygida]